MSFHIKNFDLKKEFKEFEDSCNKNRKLDIPLTVGPGFKEHLDELIKDRPAFFKEEQEEKKPYPAYLDKPLNPLPYFITNFK